MSSKKKKDPHFSLDSPIIIVSPEVILIVTSSILSIVSFSQLHFQSRMSIQANKLYSYRENQENPLVHLFYTPHPMHWCFRCSVRFNAKHGYEHDIYAMNWFYVIHREKIIMIFTNKSMKSYIFFIFVLVQHHLHLLFLVERRRLVLAILIKERWVVSILYPTWVNEIIRKQIDFSINK